MMNEKPAEQAFGAPVPQSGRAVAGPGSLSVAAGTACLVLIGIDLRPAIVSVGPLLLTPFFQAHRDAEPNDAVP